jgi:serine protease Do
MERIVVDGKVTRGYLGIKIQPVNPDVAKQSNLTQRKDALIAEVTPGVARRTDSKPEIS